MGFETQDYDEYGSSMPPEIPGEYDRTIHSVDMRMTADTGGYEQTETQIVADALGSLGLGELGQNNALGEMIPPGDEDIAPVEAQNDGQEPPAETPEVPIAAKPVVEVVEPSSARQVEVAEAATMKVWGVDCRPSCISSGFVYNVSDGVTPEMDHANRQLLLDMRREHEAQGRPLSDKNRELVATARQAILEYGERLGVDIDDRLPQDTLYRSFDREGEYITAHGGSREELIARSIPGVGVAVVDEDYLSGLPPDGGRYILAHETAHQAFMGVLFPTFNLNKHVTSWSVYEVRGHGRYGLPIYRLGMLESIADLIAMRALHCAGLPFSHAASHADEHSPSLLGYAPTDTILHGAIEKAAEQYGQHPETVADSLAKVALTGNRGALDNVMQSLGGWDRSKPLWLTTGKETYGDIREGARRLGLQNTVDLIDGRHQGSLGKLFDWR